MMARATQEQVDADLREVDALATYAPDCAHRLAAEVRALRAELVRTLDRLVNALAASTPRPAETVKPGDPCLWDGPDGVHEAGTGRDRAECRYCDGTIAAPLPTVPDEPSECGGCESPLCPTHGRLR